MKEVAVYEAKTRLSELLFDVERGQQITITRRGVPVARLLGVADARATERTTTSQRERVGSLIAQLRDQRKGIILEGDLGALIAEGRD